MIKRFLIAATMLCAFAHAVPVTPIVQPRVTFVNGAGLPCARCQLFTYAAGTTTALATYTDALGVSQNTNPIILDVAGGKSIWLGANSYKFILKDPSGVTIWSVDAVNPGNLGSCGSTGEVQIANSGGGFTCDSGITINTTTHTFNIGTLPINHVTIGALGTPTSWTFDTTSPTTARTSLGGGSIASGTINQLAIYPANGNNVQGASVIPAGITAITQSPGDNSTKPATTAYVALPGAINPSSVQVASGVAITDNQGTGTKVQHSTGTTTTNDCVKFDAGGNTVPAGAPCLTATSATQTDVTGSRALGATYQNTSGALRMIQGYITTTAGGANGVVTCSNGPTSGLGSTPFKEDPTSTDAGGSAEFHITAPAGWFYQCTATGTMNPTLGKWFETDL
jgi:hypothetical protein